MTARSAMAGLVCLALLEMTVIGPLVAGVCLAHSLKASEPGKSACCKPQDRTAKAVRSACCGCCMGGSRRADGAAHDTDTDAAPTGGCSDCLPGCPACSIVSAVLPCEPAGHSEPAAPAPLPNDNSLPGLDLQDDIFHPPRA